MLTTQLLTGLTPAAPPALAPPGFFDDYPQLRNEASVKGGLAPWQVARLTAYIDDNLAATLRTTCLAALLGLSVSHFTRAFKCTVGVPPRVFVLRRRVRAACSAMLETDEALTRIA